MRQGTVGGGRQMLRWPVLAIAGAVGFLVLVVAWWLGPDVFGQPPAEDHKVARAVVTGPVPCTDPNATETVRVELDGQQRDGTLSGCGHSPNENIEVAVPLDAGSGPVEVRLASTVEGASDLRRPVGLGLMALSSASGGVYAFLVGTPRPRARRKQTPAPAA